MEGLRQKNDTLQLENKELAASLEDAKQLQSTQQRDMDAMIVELRQEIHHWQEEARKGEGQAEWEEKASSYENLLRECQHEKDTLELALRQVCQGGGLLSLCALPVRPPLMMCCCNDTQELQTYKDSAQELQGRMRAVESETEKMNGIRTVRLIPCQTHAVSHSCLLLLWCLSCLLSLFVVQCITVS